MQINEEKIQNTVSYIWSDASGLHTVSKNLEQPVRTVARISCSIWAIDTVQTSDSLIVDYYSYALAIGSELKICLFKPIFICIFKKHCKYCDEKYVYNIYHRSFYFENVVPSFHQNFQLILYFEIRWPHTRWLT